MGNKCGTGKRTREALKKTAPAVVPAAAAPLARPEAPALALEVATTPLPLLRAPGKGEAATMSAHRRLPPGRGAATSADRDG